MQQSSGSFENINLTISGDEQKMVKIRQELQRINPQYDPGKHQDPCLSLGEIIEIKHIKFRVIRIKSDGKLGLKMLKESEIK